jgi:hypothetical protein
VERKCRQCGEPVRPDAESCSGCGHPVSADGEEFASPRPQSSPSRIFLTPPAVPRLEPAAGSSLSRKSKVPILVGLVVVALAGVIGVVAFTLGSSERAVGSPSSSSSSASLAKPSESDNLTSPVHAGGASTSPTASADQPDGEESALGLLRQRAAEDRSRAESLVGSWLPQLSAKRPGLNVNGVTFDHRKIWADFLAGRDRHPDVLLVWSGEFSSFRHGDFWITLVPTAYSSGESANGWCESAGIGRDDCYAKRLAHSGGYAGNTLLRK